MNTYYNNWWFWLFVTIMFIVLCFYVSSCIIGTEMVDKGEYKIIIEVFLNYFKISCPNCSFLSYNIYVG
jgi:hypothetical protein